MVLGDELNIIRYYLRDPDGLIWDDAFLINCYNQIQHDMQQQIQLLADVRSISVPAPFQFSYMHDWERQYTDGDNVYQCLRSQGEQIAFCKWFEIQADAADEEWIYTHPWEVWEGAVSSKSPPFPFPRNMHNVLQLFLDYQPLYSVDKREVMESVSDWFKRESARPEWYYRDELDVQQFFIYPRPSTRGEDDAPVNEGVYGVDESEETTWDMQFPPDNDVWLPAIDYIDGSDNIVLVFDITPAELNEYDDESDFPEYLRRYIRYGVLSRAYGANTDGRIQSLSDWWGRRYQEGIDTIRFFSRNILQDRIYRMVTQDPAETNRGRRKREPRLPDGYQRPWW